MLVLVTTFAGSTVTGSTDGFGTKAKFISPSGVAVNPDGTLLYVADFNSANIRTVALSSGKT
jgi:DNA-binding beta-propeller fold protein YncE